LILVRPNESSDTNALIQLHSLWHNRTVSQQEVLGRIQAVQMANGAYLVALEGEKMLGYGSYALVPGLVGWYNLHIYIHPDFRRRGTGQKLAQEIIARVRHLPDVQALMTIFPIENSDLARFCESLGLTLEKYDWQYALDSLKGLVAPDFPTGISLQHYSNNQVKRFVKLHHRSFADTLYFQPYQPEEVRYEQTINPDFLMIFAQDQAKKDIGLVWLRMESLGQQKTAIIEPLGIIPEWRSKGLGRALMLEALGQARLLQAQRSELWVQSWNTPACQLYEKLGYQRRGGKVSYTLRFTK